jgi:hypothetical protein
MISFFTPQNSDKYIQSINASSLHRETKGEVMFEIKKLIKAMLANPSN